MRPVFRRSSAIRGASDLWYARSGLEYQFLRESLLKAEVAHLDKKGELVLGKRASRTQKRGMAQTYLISWKDAETQAVTTLPITQYGLGRRVCLCTYRCCQPKLSYPGIVRILLLLLLSNTHDMQA